MKKLIKQAFVAASGGWSPDRVVADPNLNAQFIAECRRLGLNQEAKLLNRQLLNARKAKLLQGLPRPRRTVLTRTEGIQFAAEVAARFLEHQLQVTLDDILCDPELSHRFDEIASEVESGFLPLQYRWAALYLRKAKLLQPELLSQVVVPTSIQLGLVDHLELSAIPVEQGLYIFYGAKGTLYVGEADNLRRRIQKHLHHSDIREVARWIWSHGTSDLRLELHVLPEETTTRVRRALEAELIQSRRPAYNIRRR